VIVLGLDTATQSTTVALRLADGRTTQARDDPPAGEHPGHATRLLEMARELLDAAGIGWSGVDRIAVGVGPGTFTGLRVGIATARGLAQSLALELVGVSSLEALAAAALVDAHTDAQDTREAVLAVIDARRGEVFAAAYELGRDGRTVLELAAPRALAPEDLATVLAEAERSDGPGARGWLAVGDGAVRYHDRLRSLPLRTLDGSSALQRVSAEAICALGVRATPATDLSEIVPDYIRRPDAEIALGATVSGGANSSE